MLPISKHQKWKTLITRYQASREHHDVTSSQLLLIVWKMWASIEERFVGVSKTKTKTRFHSSCYSNISISLVSVWEVNFVLFNSMLKYVINRSIDAFFHIRTVILPRDRYWPEGFQDCYHPERT